MTKTTIDLYQAIAGAVADTLWRVHGPESIDRDGAEADGEEIARVILTEVLASRDDFFALREKIVSVLYKTIVEDRIVDADRTLWFTLADRIVSVLIADLVTRDWMIKRAESAEDILRHGLALRMNGETEGGQETWRDFDRRAEKHLRYYEDRGQGRGVERPMTDRGPFYHHEGCPERETGRLTDACTCGETQRTRKWFFAVTQNTSLEERIAESIPPESRACVPQVMEVVNTVQNELLDHLYTAWTVIANAGNGDWSTQTDEWQEAAERWRDRFHDMLDAQRPKDPETGG